MDELDISEEQRHPVLSEEEWAEQAAGAPTEEEAERDGPRYRSDPERRAALLHQLRDREPKARQDEMWPFLLVRAYPGDTGVRLPPVDFFWESPDILVVEGLIDRLNGEVPTLNPVPGRDHTVFVRAWNLGRFPAFATQIRVWWADPSFAFDVASPAPPVFIGAAVADLADRYRFPDCRATVAISVPWNPVVVNDGHECLLVKVECQADPAGPGWEASTQRHVGQRNLDLFEPDEALLPLLETLSLALPRGSDVHLIHGMLDIEAVLASQGPGFVEQSGLRPPAELPSTATPMRSGWGHMGALLRRDDGLVFVPGQEAAREFEALGRDERDAHEVGLEPGGDPGALTLLFERALDVHPKVAGVVAARLGGGAHLLRLVATLGGRTVGGYSVIVHQ